MADKLATQRYELIGRAQVITDRLVKHQEWREKHKKMFADVDRAATAKALTGATEKWADHFDVENPGGDDDDWHHGWPDKGDIIIGIPGAPPTDLPPPPIDEPPLNPCADLQQQADDLAETGAQLSAAITRIRELISATDNPLAVAILSIFLELFLAASMNLFIDRFVLAREARDRNCDIEGLPKIFFIEEPLVLR